MGATGLLKDKNMKDMPTVPKLGTQSIAFDDSATDNRSTGLPGNVCFIRTTADVWIKRGAVTVTGVATAGTDAFFVGANDGWWDYDIPVGKEYIVALAESGSGTLIILETDEARN